MRLPQGWVLLDGETAGKLEAELRREVASPHPLFHRPLRAVARREDRDDVLFVPATGESPVHCVHLTWSVETDAKWPHTQSYDSIDAFLESWSNSD